MLHRFSPLRLLRAAFHNMKCSTVQPNCFMVYVSLSEDAYETSFKLLFLNQFIAALYEDPIVRYDAEMLHCSASFI